MSSIKALPTTDPYANVGRVDRSFSSPAQLLLARQMAEESQAAEEERKASQEEGSTEHFSKRSAKPALQRFDTRALIKQVVTDPEAHFTSLELEDVREKFKLFDADGSDDLSVEELDVAVRYMGYYPTAAELESTLLAVDADGSGELDFKEFLSLLLKLKRDDTPDEHLERVFITIAHELALDACGNDTYARAEVEKRQPMSYLYEELPVEVLKDMLCREGPEPLDEAEALAMLREADADGNGSVSLDELRRALLGSS